MRGTRGVLPVLPLAVLLMGGCERGPGEATAVEAAGFEITVDEVASMMAPVPQLPADPSIVETVLEFWTDYLLLAWAVNQAGELDALDLSELIEQEESRAVVTRLRDEVIRPDTVVGEEELRRVFEERRPGEAVRARHILLTFPPGATDAQRDSVRTLAEELRRRAASGEDFSELASEYSQDPGSAPQGGDLGRFERGQMVAPFEEAAFALEPGGTSEVVETQFGLHIVRVEERLAPTLEDRAVELRAEIRQERMMAAESIYLDSVEVPRNVQIAEGAYPLVRTISESPAESLGREGSTPLTTYEGGELTAEEYQRFVRGIPAQVRSQITEAPDPQIEQMLRDVTRDQIILADAEERGITLEDSARDSIATEMRTQYPEIAEFLGLASIEPGEDESLREVVEREVDALMARVIANEQDVVPLGALAIPLRDRYDAEVAEDAETRIVERVNELRAIGPTPEPPAGAEETPIVEGGAGADTTP